MTIGRLTRRVALPTLCLAAFLLGLATHKYEFFPGLLERSVGGL